MGDVKKQNNVNALIIGCCLSVNDGYTTLLYGVMILVIQHATVRVQYKSHTQSLIIFLFLERVARGWSRWRATVVVVVCTLFVLLRKNKSVAGGECERRKTTVGSIRSELA